MATVDLLLVYFMSALLVPSLTIQSPPTLPVHRSATMAVETYKPFFIYGDDLSLTCAGVL